MRRRVLELELLAALGLTQGCMGSGAFEGGTETVTCDGGTKTSSIGGTIVILGDAMSIDGTYEQTPTVVA